MKACLPSNQCTVPENTKLLQNRASVKFIKEDMNALFWSIIIQSGIQNLDLMLWNQVSTISSGLDWCTGIVAK